jgi:hypothetical protein
MHSSKYANTEKTRTGRHFYQCTKQTGSIKQGSINRTARHLEDVLRRVRLAVLAQLRVRIDDHAAAHAGYSEQLDVVAAVAAHQHPVRRQPAALLDLQRGATTVSDCVIDCGRDDLVCRLAHVQQYE